MSDCSKHKKTVEKYTGNLKELAEDIGNLHYESLTEFLRLLSWKLNADANKDYDAGRVELSHKLGKASDSLEKTSKSINKAWKISEPYMK